MTAEVVAPAMQIGEARPVERENRRIPILALIRQLTALLLVVLVLTSASPGAEISRHSGVVLAVDRVAGTVILGELREWRAQHGIEIIRRPIVVEVATAFVRARRQPEAPSGYRGDWTEEALAAWGLREGDFVTVECVHEGSRLVATRITLVDVRRP